MFLQAFSIIRFVCFFQQTRDSILTAWSEQHTLQLSFLGFYGAMLALHVSTGADVVSVHTEFRPGDDQPRGYGVLIEYRFAEVPSAA